MAARGGGMQAEGWPEDVIDVSALGALDVELSLVAPSVDLGVLTLGETRRWSRSTARGR